MEQRALVPRVSSRCDDSMLDHCIRSGVTDPLFFRSEVVLVLREIEDLYMFCPAPQAGGHASRLRAQSGLPHGNHLSPGLYRGLSWLFLRHEGTVLSSPL